MRKHVSEWDLPRGKFRVEWKVTDKRDYWRVEGSGGEFFTVPKKECPTWESLKEMLNHIYDDDVARDWELYNESNPEPEVHDEWIEALEGDERPIMPEFEGAPDELAGDFDD